jgi:hypothetical protein
MIFRFLKEKREKYVRNNFSQKKRGNGKPDYQAVFLLIQKQLFLNVITFNGQ